MSQRWRLVASLVLAAWLHGDFAAQAAEPPRTVVIGSDIAEIVAELGALEGVVGRDDTSQYPADVATLPSVGYLRHLAAEGVLSLRPERLIAAASAGPGEVLTQLETSGVEVVRIQQGARLDAIQDKVMAVAKAVNREHEGETLATRIERDLQRLSALPSFVAPSTMFLLSHSGMTPMAAGRDTAAQAVIEAVGGNNAFNGFSGYKTVGSEALVAQGPEVVIATHSGLQGLGGETRLWELPGLAMTPAGRRRHLIVCDDQALLGFGPRTPAALLDLYHALRDIAKPADASEARRVDQACWRPSA